MLLPSKLVEDVMRNYSESFTRIVCDSLQNRLRADAYENLKKMRGKVKFGLTYKQIKEMRE